MSKVNRRLATILATDCVGFSKFMEADEEGTLLSLKACREIIDNLIEEHGGRVTLRCVLLGGGANMSGENG